MKNYLIATAIPHEGAGESIQEYTSKAGELLVGGGGTPLKKLIVSDVEVGQQEFTMLLLMEFESKEQINKVFESEEYKKLIPVRTKAFKTLNVLVAEGFD